jgi:hypothetical protein
VVTFAICSPPADGTSIVVGAIVKAQGAAACVTVKVCAAIVAVPVRADPGLEAMLICTEPAPVPAPLEAIVIQGAFVAAVHRQ